MSMFCSYVQRPIRKLPDTLIFQVPSMNLYRMINIKENFIAGEMIAFPKKKNLFQRELWIDALVMRLHHRNQGFGTKMLHFAQNLSERLGCKGRLGVKAVTIEQTSHIPPHKFYREYGFVAKDKRFTKYLDECIQNRIEPDFYTTPPTEMHFTP